MNINIYTKHQVEKMIRDEIEKYKELLFHSIDMMEKKIYKLEEELSTIKIKISK